MDRAISGTVRKNHVLWSKGGSVYGPAPARPAVWPPKNEISTVGIGAVLLIIPALILLFIGFIVWTIAKSIRSSFGSGWSTKAKPYRPPPVTSPARAPVFRGGRGALDAIRQTDPSFSVALFEDFLYALYTEVRVAHGAGAQSRLEPYLGPGPLGELARHPSPPVGQVVIGAMRFLGIDLENPSLYAVEVEFEANYAETPPGGAESAYWVSERWTLTRSRSAQSRSPERARVLDCPGCGAPIEKVVGGQCRHCNRVVGGGQFDWLVKAIVIDGKQPRGPMLTGTTEERGTELSTVVDPHVEPNLAALRAKDPAFSMRTLQRRVGLVFMTMQHAWTSLEWPRARPFLSDNLYEAQRYWIESYRKAGLRNVTENARILRIDVARVTRDAYFDAITLRVHATGLDYTVQASDGAVVGGNRHTERRYSEYWTLLRGTGVTGPAHVEPVCPRCGAALQVTMTSTCTHCQAKVNSAAFDWVLARIEQDESYTG
jgi:hypothetical protein